MVFLHHRLTSVQKHHLFTYFESFLLSPLISQFEPKTQQYFIWRGLRITNFSLYPAPLQQTDEQHEVVLHLSFPVKVWDETGRKRVLLLRACLQWDFKVFWLNAFIWKGSPRKAATWLGAAMAVKSQQQGAFEYFAASKNKLHGLDRHGNWAGLVFDVEGGERVKKRDLLPSIQRLDLLEQNWALTVNI